MTAQEQGQIIPHLYIPHHQNLAPGLGRFCALVGFLLHLGTDSFCVWYAPMLRHGMHRISHLEPTHFAPHPTSFLHGPKTQNQTTQKTVSFWEKMVHKKGRFW